MNQFPPIPLGPFQIFSIFAAQGKFAAGIVDTSSKFATGINNTSSAGGKIATGVVDTSGAP